jgi:hypothetical protein
MRGVIQSVYAQNLTGVGVCPVPPALLIVCCGSVAEEFEALDDAVVAPPLAREVSPSDIAGAVCWGEGSPSRLTVPLNEVVCLPGVGRVGSSVAQPAA